MIGTKIGRRQFVVAAAVVAGAIQLPLSACKKLISKSDGQMSPGEQKTLLSVLNHLLPGGVNSPGALEINALDYFNRLFHDPSLAAWEKKSLKRGIARLEQKALDLEGKSFIALDHGLKEYILREIEKEKKGRDWLKQVLKYLLEALLGDPVYQINRQEAGWKMVGHVPGIPRPDETTKYPYL